MYIKMIQSKLVNLIDINRIDFFIQTWKLNDGKKQK